MRKSSSSSDESSTAAKAREFIAKRTKLSNSEGVHVQWDEETIAEHDKERGTRQKIDEPDTPYRYGEDDDYDDYTSSITRENATGMIDIPGASGLTTDAKSPPRHGYGLGESPQSFAASPPAQVGDNVMDVWESLRAKLTYEQQQQQQRSSGTVQPATEHIRIHEKVKAASAAGAMSTESSATVATDTETVGFDREPAPPTDAFKSKRSAHYNEFQLMKAMAARMAAEEDDEEDDEEDGHTM